MYIDSYTFFSVLLPVKYRSSNHGNSDICCYFLHLNTYLKPYPLRVTTAAIAIVGRAMIATSIKKLSKENWSSKNNTKKIKIVNSKWNNRKKL